MQNKTEKRFRILLEDRETKVTQEIETDNLFFAVADGDGENTEAYGKISHGSDVFETLGLLARVNKQFKELAIEVSQFLRKIIEDAKDLESAMDAPSETRSVQEGRVVKTREGKYLLNGFEIRENDSFEMNIDGEWQSAYSQTLDGEMFAILEGGRFEPLIGAAVRKMEAAE